MQTFENAIDQFVACKEPCSFAFNSDNQRTNHILLLWEYAEEIKIL